MMMQPERELSRKAPKNAAFLELLPLLSFFITYQLYGLMVATAVLMAASSAALAYAHFKWRYRSMPLVVGTVLLMVFGSMALIFQDETFIKMRPTLVNFLLGAVLLVGVYGFKRGLLSSIFHMAFELNARGWMVLSTRFGWFFLSLAALNEIIWRTQTTEFWVNYKVFGAMGLTMIFTLCQLRMIARHKP